MRSDLREAIERAAQTPAAASIAAQGNALDDSLAAVQDELVQMNIRNGNDVLSYPAKLNNLIAALAPVVAATDAAPTAQSYEVFDDLSRGASTRSSRASPRSKRRTSPRSTPRPKRSTCRPCHGRAVADGETPWNM